MSEQRGRYTTGPRSAARSRGAQDAMFAEQEKLRIKHLKESLLGGASVAVPAQTSPAAPIALFQHADDTVENGAEGSAAPLRNQHIPASVDAGLSAPIDLSGERDIQNDGRHLPRLYTEGEFLCCRCLSIPNNPILLSCGHRCCSDCGVELFEYHRAIDDLARGSAGSSTGGSVECPDCSTVTTIRDAQALTERKDTEAPSPPLCCVCNTANATLQCTNCIAPFCITCCTEFHSKSEHFQRHRWCELAAAPGKKRCAVHTKGLDMFCSTCKVAACSRCFLGDDGAHRSHTAVPIEVIAAPAAGNFRTGIGALRETADKIQTAIAQIEECTHAVSRAHDEASDAVRTKFAELRAQLAQRESELLTELAAVRDAKVHSLSQQAASLASLTSEIRATAAAAERTADMPASGARDVTVLSLDARMEHRRRVANVLETRFKPRASTELHVDLTRNAPTFDKFGAVL